MTAPKNPEEKQKPGPKPKPKAQGPLHFEFQGLMFRDTPELIFLKINHPEMGEILVGGYNLPEGVLIPREGVAYFTEAEATAYQQLYKRTKDKLQSGLILPKHPSILKPEGYNKIVVDSDN